MNIHRTRPGGQDLVERARIATFAPPTNTSEPGAGGEPRVAVSKLQLPGSARPVREGHMVPTPRIHERTGNADGQAVRWTNDVIEVLPSPGDETNTGNGIDPAGRVAGARQASAGSELTHATLWDQVGAATDLTPDEPAGGQTVASAINA